MSQLNRTDTTPRQGSKSRLLKSLLLWGTALSGFAAPTLAVAQEEPVQTTTDTAETTADTAQTTVDNDDDKVLDAVVVEGIRGTVQSTINIKRTNTSIVDGLSADDIDGLPALSIAETLETITSVASQREGSGATEVSIRGLGPFLGSTVINGREATNGSGDRSVNFSQFPSELFNKIEIYKTQEASLIEGGVAGQISLSTLKPLEYNKRRTQLQAKFNVNPQNLDIDSDQRIRDFGYRLTGSHVDQWDTPIGRFGLSIGLQTNVTPNPEQEARSSSTFDACILAGLDSSSCDGSFPNLEGNELIGLDGQPITDRLGATEPFVLTTSSRSFRQNITDDDRDAIFGAVQWQPNDRLDINFDLQYSDRTFTEFRSDVVFDSNDILEVDLDVAPILNADGSLTFTTAADDLDDEIFALTIAPDGSLRQATTTGDIEVNSQFSERIEEYIGFGGGFSYDITDRLSFVFDAGYSDTSRRENQIQARVVTGGTTLIGIDVLGEGSDAQTFTLVDQDVTDPTNFTDDNVRVREDLNQFRNHQIWSLRGDLEYDIDTPFFTSVASGVRYSVQSYDQLPRVRNEFEFDDGGDEFAEFVTEINNTPVTGSNIATLAAQVCARDSFPESGFLSSVVDGDLITNVDEDGNVLEAGTGSTFLTFDALCLGETLLGRPLGVPSAEDASGADLVQSVDIEEDTIALYTQANFDSRIGNFPIRGNIGVRWVNTDVTSSSFRSNLIAELDPDGNIIDLTASLDQVVPIESRFSYNEFLPSLNVVTELRDDVLLRGGIFRALSRPDPSSLGFGRTFQIQNTEETDTDITVEDFIGNIVSNGNPQLEPFLSWNFDAAAEWYPNEDTLLAVGLYYKTFNGGFENILQPEVFNVNGEDFTALVPVQSTNSDNSEIFGIELTATHAFTYLPGYLSGFGFKVSYNYADSNFEFEDGRLGEAVVPNEDGTFTELSGLIPPANLRGLSEHTLSGQVYYEYDRLSVAGIIKYRSDFFQDFISTPQNLRFIDDATVFEARINYKLTNNIRLRLEGVNLFDEPREQFNPTLDSFAEINNFGPRYFIGITAKF